MPQTIEYVGADSFRYCKSLENITLPKTIESIGADAFDDCYCLETIVYQGTTTEWNNISKGENRNDVREFTVQCSDGDVVIDRKER